MCEEAGSAFSSGARQCKWPVSGSQRAVQRPLLISRGSNMEDLNCVSLQPDCLCKCMSVHTDAQLKEELSLHAELTLEELVLW